MKCGVTDDCQMACTSREGVFMRKEPEWPGRSQEKKSKENHASASLPNLSLGEFHLPSRAAGRVASSWESHSVGEGGVSTSIL